MERSEVWCEDDGMGRGRLDERHGCREEEEEEKESKQSKAGDDPIPLITTEDRLDHIQIALTGTNCA